MTRPFQAPPEPLPHLQLVEAAAPPLPMDSARVAHSPSSLSQLGCASTPPAPYVRVVPTVSEPKAAQVQQQVSGVVAEVGFVRFER
jgi:hypothetical protein